VAYGLFFVTAYLSPETQNRELDSLSL